MKRKQQPPPAGNILVKVPKKMAIEIQKWFANPLMPFIHFDSPIGDGRYVRVEFEWPGPIGAAPVDKKDIQ